MLPSSWYKLNEMLPLVGKLKLSLSGSPGSSGAVGVLLKGLGLWVGVVVVCEVEETADVEGRGDNIELPFEGVIVRLAPAATSPLFDVNEPEVAGNDAEVTLQ